MGMFDFVRHPDGTDWQTKAFKRLMNTYEIGEKVDYPLASFQFAIYGGPSREQFRDSLATVVDGLLMAVDVERKPELDLVDYHGSVVERITEAPATRGGVPNLSQLGSRVAAGEQLTPQEAQSLLQYAKDAVTQRETMRRSLSEAAGRNIDLHQRIPKEIEAARADERARIADEVETWLKTGENAECFEDVQLVAFIRTGE